MSVLQKNEHPTFTRTINDISKAVNKIQEN